MNRYETDHLTVLGKFVILKGVDKNLSNQEVRYADAVTVKKIRCINLTGRSYFQINWCVNVTGTD